MDFLTDPNFWGRWIRIVILDICLAGDNALVIALAVRGLQPREQFWGRVWGTAGAVGLRIGFIFGVSFLMQVPLLRFGGGLALLWIAFKLLRGENEDPAHGRHATTLREAIWIIVVADVVMSLDNVLAIAAAAQDGAGHTDMTLVIFGLLLSIPLVVWGSGVLAKLMQRFPVIIWLGGGVLGFVAVEMMLHDNFVRAWLGPALTPLLHRFLPVSVGVALTALGWLLARQAEAAKRIPEET
jgi:YjbE family integral membrane protein